MFRSKDDLPTLRVTNVSEDTTDNDLRDLFSVFGRVARVYIGRDRETGIGKGYAFVSFEDRAAAQKAMEKVHGKGYDNLILNVQWSRKCYIFLVVAIGWGLIWVFRAEGTKGWPVNDLFSLYVDTLSGGHYQILYSIALTNVRPPCFEGASGCGFRI